jgi:hypothetical protein
MEEPSYWQERFPAGRRLGALIGGPAAYGGAALLGQGWAACDVGVNSGTLLLFVLPLLWIVNTFLFGLVFAVLSGSARRQKLLGVLAGIAAVFLFAWSVFAWQGTPADSPDPRCPGGVPIWWPSFSSSTSPMYSTQSGCAA